MQKAFRLVASNKNREDVRLPTAHAFPRGACGEGGARPQEGADKRQGASGLGRRFCKALRQKGPGEPVEGGLEAQFSGGVSRVWA
jgi:hypothetical protein